MEVDVIEAADEEVRSLDSASLSISVRRGVDGCAGFAESKEVTSGVNDLTGVATLGEGV